MHEEWEKRGDPKGKSFSFSKTSTVLMSPLLGRTEVEGEGSQHAPRSPTPNGGLSDGKSFSRTYLSLKLWRSGGGFGGNGNGGGGDGPPGDGGSPGGGEMVRMAGDLPGSQADQVQCQLHSLKLWALCALRHHRGMVVGRAQG